MSASNRRAHRRYPAWFPINLRIDGQPEALPAMLCDVSAGGALVSGVCPEPGSRSVVMDVSFRSESFEIPATVVAVERQWDTVILHLQFPEGLAFNSPTLEQLLGELRVHFEAHQVYLAYRADDDPALGRTATQYPGDRASA